MPQPSILLVHGGITGAWIWDAWRRYLRDLGWQVSVLDLRGHGRSLPADLSLVTMEDYVADLASVTRQIEAQGLHPIVGGWSMGGLVAMMYAAANPQTPALLLFAPSPPLEVAGKASIDEVRQTPSGAFGPKTYGLYPGEPLEASREALHDLADGEARRVLQQTAEAQESGMARRQRRRGISIAQDSIRCPALVVYGEQDRRFAPELQRQLALYLAAGTLPVTEAGHWGIVCHEPAVARAAPGVDAWLREYAGSG